MPLYDYDTDLNREKLRHFQNQWKCRLMMNMAHQRFCGVESRKGTCARYEAHNGMLICSRNECAANARQIVSRLYVQGSGSYSFMEELQLKDAGHGGLILKVH